MGVVYANYGLLGSRDSEWLQVALNSRIGLFRKIGLVANAAKSKMMMCQPVVIISGILVEAFGQISTGKGTTYRERLRRKCLQPYCGVDMTASSMTAHQQLLYVADL